MMKKVSVIVPAYNTELYVEEALSSIMNQTYRELEIIVVDDGSTDGTLDIIRRLQKEDERIRVFSTPNNGVSVARNLGIANATGDYIYFFDSDDVLEPDAIELCLEKCEAEQCDMVIFDAAIIDESHIVNGVKFDYCRCSSLEGRTYGGVELLEILLKQKSNAYSSSSILLFARKSLIRGNNIFYYPYIVHEDELFVFTVYAHAKKVGIINRRLFRRRLRQGSIMTNRFGVKNAMGLVTVLRQLRRIAENTETSDRFRKVIKLNVKRIASMLVWAAPIMKKNAEWQQIRNIVRMEFVGDLKPDMWLKFRFPEIYKVLKGIKDKY